MLLYDNADDDDAALKKYVVVVATVIVRLGGVTVYNVPYSHNNIVSRVSA